MYNNISDELNMFILETRCRIAIFVRLRWLNNKDNNNNFYPRQENGRGIAKLQDGGTLVYSEGSEPRFVLFCNLPD